MQREQLESALVSDPFNIAYRLRYAHLLLEARQADAALTQFELAERQRADAASLTGKAQALLALERQGEAVTA